MTKLTKSVREARKKPGGSNAGKYKKETIFAGTAGGAPKGTYPLTENGKKSIKRGKSALKLAHNAPNPAGIKAKVLKTFPSLKKSSSKKGK
jgi:hypothetical protein